MNTTWYLHSHLVWLKLSNSSIDGTPFRVLWRLTIRSFVDGLRGFDRRKRQTLAASPAEPGDLLFWFRPAAINTLAWTVPIEGPISVTALGGGAAAVCASDSATMVGAPLAVVLTNGGVSMEAGGLAGPPVGLVAGSVIATTGMPAVVVAALLAFLTEDVGLTGSRATWSG